MYSNNNIIIIIIIRIKKKDKNENKMKVKKGRRAFFPERESACREIYIFIFSSSFCFFLRSMEIGL